MAHELTAELLANLSGYQTDETEFWVRDLSELNITSIEALVQKYDDKVLDGIRQDFPPDFKKELLKSFPDENAPSHDAQRPLDGHSSHVRALPQQTTDLYGGSQSQGELSSFCSTATSNRAASQCSSAPHSVAASSPRLTEVPAPSDAAAAFPPRLAVRADLAFTPLAITPQQAAQGTIPLSHDDYTTGISPAPPGYTQVQSNAKSVCLRVAARETNRLRLLFAKRMDRNNNDDDNNDDEPPGRTGFFVFDLRDGLKLGHLDSQITNSLAVLRMAGTPDNAVLVSKGGGDLGSNSEVKLKADRHPCLFVCPKESFSFVTIRVYLKPGAAPQNSELSYIDSTTVNGAIDAWQTRKRRSETFLLSRVMIKAGETCFVPIMGETLVADAVIADGNFALLAVDWSNVRLCQSEDGDEESLCSPPDDKRVLMNSGGQGKLFRVTGRRGTYALKVITDLRKAAEDVMRRVMAWRRGQQGERQGLVLHLMGLRRGSKEDTIAMELLGPSLAQECSSRFYCQWEVVTWFYDIAEQLALFDSGMESDDNTQNRKVLHLDIKPPNVCIRDEGGFQRAVLIDYDAGHTRSAHSGPESSTKHTNIVTLRNSAPEQIACEPTSVKTDVYLAAFTALLLLSGRLTGVGDDKDHLKLKADLQNDIESMLSALENAGDACLENLCATVLRPCLRVTKEERPSPSELLAQISQVAHGSPITDRMLEMRLCTDTNRVLTEAPRLFPRGRGCPLLAQARQTPNTPPIAASSLSGRAPTPHGQKESGAFLQSEPCDVPFPRRLGIAKSSSV